MIHCNHRCHSLNVQAVGIVILQIEVYFFDNLGIVRPVLVQPKNNRGCREPGSIDSQFNPVFDGYIFYRTSAEDISLFYIELMQNLSSPIKQSDGAFSSRFKCFIVRPVFLRLFCHEANVRHRSHSGWIECAILSTKIDGRLINTGITAIRYHGQGVIGLAIRAPHLPGGTNRSGHGSIDNDVTRNMKICDAFVGVHHRQIRSILDAGLNIRFDFFLLVGGQTLYLCVNIA